MASRFGIDTSILVRLATGEPPHLYAYCMRELGALRGEGAEILVSSQVIGETYFAVQHHYKVSERETRAALLGVLRGGLVTPLNGESVLAALQAGEQPGLLDRLIVESYSRANLETLTLDARMAALPGARSI